MAGTTAEARKASAQKKVKATASETRKRPKYPDNIREAAARSREIAGTSMAPGPKQHVMTREVLGDRKPIEASGMTLAALRRYARGEDSFKRNAEETAKLRALANEVPDTFVHGRHLAAILVAYHEEQTAAQKAEKAAAKGK